MKTNECFIFAQCFYIALNILTMINTMQEMTVHGTAFDPRKKKRSAAGMHMHADIIPKESNVKRRDNVYSVFLHPYTVYFCTHIQYISAPIFLHPYSVYFCTHIQYILMNSDSKKLVYIRSEAKVHSCTPKQHCKNIWVVMSCKKEPC